MFNNIYISKRSKQRVLEKYFKIVGGKYRMKNIDKYEKPFFKMAEMCSMGLKIYCLKKRVSLSTVTDLFITDLTTKSIYKILGARDILNLKGITLANKYNICDQVIDKTLRDPEIFSCIINNADKEDIKNMLEIINLHFNKSKIVSRNEK